MAILTTAEYQSYTGATLTGDQTTYVNALIPVVQNEIETYLDRLLNAQDWKEWHCMDSCVLVDQYPVNSVKYIGSLRNVATFDDLTYTYEVTETELNIVDSALNTTTITFGGAIAVLTDIKTAVELAFPAITMTIVAGFENMSYKLLKAASGRYVYGAERVDCSTQITDHRTMSFVWDTAMLCYDVMDLLVPNYLYIVYNAGYATADMPPILKMIAVNCIKDILTRQGMGSAGVVSGIYKSESITNYSYTLFDNAGTNTSNIASIVQKYYGDLEPFRKKTIDGGC